MKRIQNLSLCLLALPALLCACNSSSVGAPTWPPDAPEYVEPPHVSQETVDSLILQIFGDWGEPSSYDWEEHAGWTDADLWGAMEALYRIGEVDGHDWREIALCLMGATGMLECMPTLISAYDEFPADVAAAMSGMESEYAIYLMIDTLDHPIQTARVLAARGLQDYEYFSEFRRGRDMAIAALTIRQSIEPDLLVRYEIGEALNIIESGS